MEVSLQAPALGVAGLDDPRARLAQLLELGAQLGQQPLVLERQARRSRDRLQQRRILGERGVVDDGGDPFSPAFEHGHAPAHDRDRLDRGAVDADVGVRFGHPVSELKRGIAQRAGERVAQVAGLGRCAPAQRPGR